MTRQTANFSGMGGALLYDLLLSDSVKLGAAASFILMITVLLIKALLGISVVETLWSFFVLAAPIMVAITYFEVMTIVNNGWGIGDGGVNLQRPYTDKRERLGHDHQYPTSIDPDQLKPPKGSTIKQEP